MENTILNCHNKKHVHNQEYSKNEVQPLQQTMDTPYYVEKVSVQSLKEGSEVLNDEFGSAARNTSWRVAKTTFFQGLLLTRITTRHQPNPIRTPAFLQKANARRLQ